MGSKLIDLLNILVEQGYRQMTVIGHRYRGVYIANALESLDDDNPNYVAFEQVDGTMTIYQRDPELHTFAFVTSVMR